MATTTQREIVVIGGGIIGMLTARELALAGAQVCLVERQATGRESSWAGGGIVSPLYPWRYPEAVTALAAWSQTYYETLVAEVQRESGIDPEWVQSGLLMLDVEDAAAAHRWAKDHGQGLDDLDASALRALEPGLAQGRSGLWMPQVGQVRNPRLAQALHLSLDTLGVEVREQTSVTGLRVTGGRVQGVETTAGEIGAAQVVVAGGAWSAELLAAYSLPIAVEPVKGQMILFQAEPGAIAHIVLDQGKYVIPRRDGLVLAGSTLEYVGFDKTPTQAALAELRRAAEALFPLLAGCPVVRQWAGLRPGTHSGIPYIGAHPQVAGLYLNAGHFRNGVVLAPASARLMAELVLGRKPCLDPSPYALAAPH